VKDVTERVVVSLVVLLEEDVVEGRLFIERKVGGETSILFRIYEPLQTTANANNNTNPYPSASLAVRLSLWPCGPTKRLSYTPPPPAPSTSTSITPPRRPYPQHHRPPPHPSTSHHPHHRTPHCWNIGIDRDEDSELID